MKAADISSRGAILATDDSAELGRPVGQVREGQVIELHFTDGSAKTRVAERPAEARFHRDLARPVPQRTLSHAVWKFVAAVMTADTSPVATRLQGRSSLSSGFIATNQARTSQGLSLSARLSQIDEI